MRLNHMLGSMAMRERPDMIRIPDETFAIAHAAALANGNLRLTAHPLAAKI